MLSVNSEHRANITDRRQRSSEINNVILRASSELAECKSDEIEKTIQQTIVDIRKIECADQAGWFFLNESGTLLEVLRSTCNSPPLCLAFRGLRGLPWCLAQLCAGKAVVIDSLNDLLLVAQVDHEFLRASGVYSIALIPTSSVSSSRRILILLSMSTELKWSDAIVERYTLLENIFSNAYQRRLAQEESIATVKCFQQLFLTSTTAMALFDNEGQFVSTNPAFRCILGYSENELQQMDCEDIIHLANQLDKSSLLKYFSSYNIVNHHLCERSLIRKDLGLIPARIKVDLIERHSPEQSLSLVSIEDLTEHNIRESELCRRKTEISVLASQLIQSQENERKRLSRELHDDIGQRLSLVASEVALLASQHSKATPVSVDRLTVLRDELDGLCSDIHEMSHNLHSYKLQHLGLKSALQDLCRRLSQPNFHVDLHADEFEEPISKDVALCLYRVAQESLNNALKHAHTSIVAVTLAKIQNTFYMTIQDSGIGFDSSVSSQGLGLMSMSERLKLVNGQFELHSVLGRGTGIWVQVPNEGNTKELSSDRRPPHIPHRLTS